MVRQKRHTAFFLLRYFVSLYQSIYLNVYKNEKAVLKIMGKRFCLIFNLVCFEFSHRFKMFIELLRARVL